MQRMYIDMVLNKFYSKNEKGAKIAPLTTQTI
jgi:hypothetical protein